MGPCPKSGEMQVQAETDTSNCYNSFIKGYYFLLHLFEILMDEYTYNSQLSCSCFPILGLYFPDLYCCIPILGDYFTALVGFLLHRASLHINEVNYRLRH